MADDPLLDQVLASEADPLLAQVLSDQAAGQVAPAQVVPVAKPQDQSWTRYPRLAAQAIARGTAGALGLPGDLLHLGQTGIDYGNRLLGLPSYAQGASPLPTSQGILDWTGTSRDLPADLTPGEGPGGLGEKIGYRGLEGLTGGALSAPLGGGLVKAALSGLLGNVAGGAAADVAPGSTMAPLVAGTLGGFGGAGLGAGLERAVMGNPAKQALAAAQRAHDGATAEVAAAKAEARALEDNPPKQQVLEEAGRMAQGMHDGADEAIAGVVADHGGPQSLEDAGRALQAKAHAYLNGSDEGTLGGEMDRIYFPIDSLMPDGGAAPATTFVQRVKDLTKGNGTLQEFSKFLDSRLPNQWRGVINTSEAEAAEANAAKAGRTGPIDVTPSIGQDSTWGELRTLRRQLGAALSDPKLSGSSGEAADLRSLYQALSEDQRNAASAMTRPLGMDGAAMINQAHAQAEQLHQTVRETFGKIVSAAKEGSDPAPGDVAAKLLGAGGRNSGDLSVLRNMMPQETDGLLAAHLTDNSGAIDPSKWNKLSTAAKQALVNDQAHATTLNTAVGTKDAADQLLKEASAHAQQAQADASLMSRRRIQDAADAHKGTAAELDRAAEAANSGASADSATRLRHTITNLASGAAGYGVGSGLSLGVLEQIAPLLSHGLATSAAGGLLGLGLPVAGRGLVGAVSNPRSLANPLIGASQGLAAD